MYLFNRVGYIYNSYVLEFGKVFVVMNVVSKFCICL